MSATRDHLQELWAAWMRETGETISYRAWLTHVHLPSRDAGGIIRHGARSDYEDWLAKHPGQTEADYQRAIEDADTPEG